MMRISVGHVEYLDDNALWGSLPTSWTVISIQACLLHFLFLSLFHLPIPFVLLGRLHVQILAQVVKFP